MILATHMRPLPARPVPRPGESLTSLLRRAAQAMEYRGARQVQDLLAITDTVRFDPDCLLPGTEMECLAALLRCDIERLVSMTAHHFAGLLVLSPQGSAPPTACDPTTVARYFVNGAHPVCPACLAQDSEPYERLLWRFRPLAICLLHGCMLLRQCPKCRRALRRDRLAVDRCSCGTTLQDVDSPELAKAVVHPLRSLSQWLGTDKSPISDLSVAAGFNWADQLVRAIIKTPTWLESLASEWHVPTGTPQEILGWAGAADILAHWPERFYDFLKALQMVPKRKRHATGTTVCFGQLPVIAAKLERLGHTAPAEALREYLLERFTAGQLSIRIAVFRGRNLRELLDRRPWVAHTEAARLLGMHHAAVAELVRAGSWRARCSRRAIAAGWSAWFHAIRSSGSRTIWKIPSIAAKLPSTWESSTRLPGNWPRTACWNALYARAKAGASRAAPWKIFWSGSAANRPSRRPARSGCRFARPFATWALTE